MFIDNGNLEPSDYFGLNIQMKIIQSDTLPVEQTARACDILTKEEVKVGTGKFIHIVKTQDIYYVSKTVLDQLKEGNNGVF